MIPDAEVIELDQQTLEALLDEIEAKMGAETARPFAYYWDGAYRCCR